MVVQQGPLKTPVVFLQRLEDDLQKHANIVLEYRKRKSS
jgi:hypothetical protein